MARRPVQGPFRRIDIQRRAGGRADVPGDVGAIVIMKPIHGPMYFVAERGTSSAVFADHIDPLRRNPNIPQIVQQRELAYGADAPFIQKTLCIAVELMQAVYLPNGFQTDRCLEIALAAARDLASVADAVTDLKAREAATRVEVEAGRFPLGHLPHTQNLRGIVEQAVSHLRAVRVGALQVAELFYPKPRHNAPADTHLMAIMQGLFDAADPFLTYFDAQLRALSDLATYRDAIIHPKAGVEFIVTDYSMAPEGHYLAPTVEVRHPISPLARMDVVQFLEVQADIIGNVFEMFLVAFCNFNAQQQGGVFESAVAELPEGEFRRGTRFYWHSWLTPGAVLHVNQPGDGLV